MVIPIYNRQSWVLGFCTVCGRANYVEPHGLTAQCRCQKAWTEHEPIPYSLRVGIDRMFVRLSSKWMLLPSSGKSQARFDASQV